jgi:MFS family permease
VSGGPTVRAGGTSLLLLAVAATIFERQALSPLFKPIANDFRSTIATVALAATAFLVLYGLAQPVTGVLSDRHGRIPMLRFAVGGAAVAAALSAVATGPAWLIAARGAAGAMNAAIYPTALVYIAETTAFQVRQREIAKLSVATSTATALSVLSAGAIAYWASWRLAFVIPAVCFAFLAWKAGALPEPPRAATVSAMQQLRSVLHRPWALAVIALAFGEGAVLFGFLNYFAPMLEVHGVNPALAGGTFAVYGLAVLAAVPLLRALSMRAAPALLIALGGAGTATSYLILVVNDSLLAVVAASLCAGFGFTMMHTTVQAWATEVAPDARGTAVGLFAGTLFLGGGVATAAVAPLAGTGDFRVLFLIGFLSAVPVVAVLAAARSFFRAAERPSRFESAVES